MITGHIARGWFKEAIRARGEAHELRQMLMGQEVTISNLERRVASLKAAMGDYEERLHNAKRG